jgi:hypothetical protein
MTPPIEARRDRTKEILDRHLDADFWCAAQQEAPSAHEVEAFGAKYGCRLPDEFIAHSIGNLGGIYVEVKENVWPRPKLHDVGPFWTFLYAVFVYGFSREAPDWMNLERAVADFRQRTGHPLVPCLKLVGDANIYLFDAAGQIVGWDHETDEIEPYEGSFFDLLDREVGELRQRKNRKLKEGGS